MFTVAFDVNLYQKRKGKHMRFCAMHVLSYLKLLLLLNYLYSILSSLTLEQEVLTLCNPCSFGVNETTS